MVKDFFENRFTPIVNNKIVLDNIEFPSITPDESSTFISNIEEREIDEVVNECGIDKSLGLGEFSFDFIKNN